MECKILNSHMPHVPSPDTSLSLLKLLRGMTSTFGFLFSNEIVYTTDHDLIFFLIFRFKKTFFINIYYNPEKT